MRLTQLEPWCLKIDPQNDHVYHLVESIPDADGLDFLCPVCFAQNKGPIGTHRIICWKLHVPQTISPTPGRWEILGSSFEDLTLRAGSSSVLLQGAPCKAHFFIRSGEIVLT